MFTGVMYQQNVEGPKTGMNSRFFLWVLLSLAGIVRIVLGLHLLPEGLFDDAYITFRYARNLVRGLGLVYNPGERVLGTTSPLFTFLLAVGARILGPNQIEQIAMAIGILAALGTVYFLERVLRTVGMPEEVKWTYLSLLCFLPSFLTNSTSGMETALVLFLMSLSLYFYVENKLIALSIVGGLLFLSRIDTCIWLLALGIPILCAPKRRTFYELLYPFLLFSAVVGMWLCFTQLYFGSVIPQSVVGKAVSHEAFVLPDWHYALTFLSAFIPAARFGPWGFLIFAFGFLLLLPPAIDLYKRYAPLRPLVLFFPLYVGLFLASHAPLFSWYVMPPKWAFYFIAVYALWVYLSRLIAFFRIPAATIRALYLLSVFFFALSLIALRRQPESRIENPWIAISNYIERNLPAEGSLFLEHIGLIGYSTNRYIYDYMGLVTPETTRLRQKYGSDWLPKAAREYNADVVVLYDCDIPAVESEQNNDALWFQTSYSHIRDYQLHGLTISMFRKKEK